MRLLLLLALLLQLAPTPASVSTHCGDHDVSAMAGAHGGDHHGAAGAEHEECPHCPPTECGLQAHCPQPTALLFVVTLATGVDAVVPASLLGDVAGAVASWGERPPIRPPVPLLT